MTDQNKIKRFLREYFFNVPTFFGGLLGSGAGHGIAWTFGSAVDVYQRVNGIAGGNFQNILHSYVNVPEYAGWGGLFGGVTGVLVTAKARKWVYSSMRRLVYYLLKI